MLLPSREVEARSGRGADRDARRRGPPPGRAGGVLLVTAGQIGVTERRMGSGPVVVALRRPWRQGNADVEGAAGPIS